MSHSGSEEDWLSFLGCNHTEQDVAIMSMTFGASFESVSRWPEQVT